MKKIIFHFVLPFSILFASACNNANTNTADNTTTDTVATDSVEKKEEKPAQKSRYQPLSTSIHVGRLTENQSKFFQQFVTPKQTSFEQAERGQSNRSDTLYTVSYLPYKDQELYLYQAVFNRTQGSGYNYWCISIAKEGALLIDEHIISDKQYASIDLVPMKNGDKNLEFIATKLDGTTENITLPYDGKKLK